MRGVKTRIRHAFRAPGEVDSRIRAPETPEARSSKATGKLRRNRAEGGRKKRKRERERKRKRKRKTSM